jgi:hypothetical protein
MQKLIDLKTVVLNLLMVSGAAVTWIAEVNEWLRMIAALVTIAVGVMSLVKHLKRDKKNDGQ